MVDGLQVLERTEFLSTIGFYAIHYSLYTIHDYLMLFAIKSLTLPSVCDNELSYKVFSTI